MASREILSLDTATPQIVAPQTGDTYSAPRAVAISPEPLTGTSATTSLDIAQTWNTTGTPTAVKLNVTDTASNAASLLMDLQVGGTSQFKVSKGGIGTFGNNILCGTGASIGLGATGAAGWWSSGTGLRVTSTDLIGWVASTNAQAAADTILVRDNAANTLAQRNATNAQTFRVYNTYTDASNYERGFVRWATNVLEIGAESSGTGTTRDVKIQAPTAKGIFLSIGSTIPVTINSDRCLFDSAAFFGFSDIRIYRAAANILNFGATSTSTGSALQMQEMTAPAAPAANGVRIYAEDNGAGKTRLMALFNTGAAQQIAIEP